MNRLFITLLATVAALYPLLVYFGLSRWGVAPLAALLLATALLRMLLTHGWRKPLQRWLIALLTLLCAAAWVEGSPAALKVYPVLMNAAATLTFALSLQDAKPLLERIAERFTTLDDDDLDARPYLRKLTLIWALLLGANTLVSAYMACCMTTQAWAVYNGAIVYGLFAGFMLAEWIFRHFYRRHYHRKRNSSL